MLVHDLISSEPDTSIRSHVEGKNVIDEGLALGVILRRVEDLR